MKNVFLAIILLFAVTACNQSSNKTEKEETTATETISTSDDSIVNVYYFHGKQRCKTCIAVGNVAQETIEKNFNGNSKVHFTELNTEDEANTALVEKYDVSWNALIIAKGEQSKDITDDAFSTALGNPTKLSEDIITIVKSMLEEK